MFRNVHILVVSIFFIVLKDSTVTNMVGKPKQIEKQKSARHSHLYLTINIISQKVLFDFPLILWLKIDDS